MNRKLALDVIIDGLELKASILITKLYHIEDKEGECACEVHSQINKINETIEFLTEELN